MLVLLEHELLQHPLGHPHACHKALRRVILRVVVVEHPRHKLALVSRMQAKGAEMRVPRMGVEPLSCRVLIRLERKIKVLVIVGEEQPLPLRGEADRIAHVHVVVLPHGMHPQRGVPPRCLCRLGKDKRGERRAEELRSEDLSVALRPEGRHPAPKQPIVERHRADLGHVDALDVEVELGLAPRDDPSEHPAPHPVVGCALARVVALHLQGGVAREGRVGAHAQARCRDIRRLIQRVV
mmetsp:Transcript_26143/g.50969  ORF Transcript_26143/g.50969 Transcript_26143/m.50969 type:complete len:238 (-) Transcript_26143:2088-2801(-)